MSDIIFNAFLIVMCVFVVLTFLFIAMHEARLEFHRRRMENTQQLSVLVFIRGDTNQLQECLESIHRSEYEHFDVIVVDQHKYDAAKSYKKILHRGERYYRPQKVMSFRKQIIEAHRRSKKGDVVVIHSNARINELTLTECARSADLNPSNATYFTLATNGSYSFTSLVRIVNEAVVRLYAQVGSLFGKQKSMQPQFDHGYVIPKRLIRSRTLSAKFEHSVKASYTSDSSLMKSPSRVIVRILWLSIIVITLYVLSKEYFGPVMTSLYLVASAVIVFQVLQGSDNSFNQKITVVLSIALIPAILVSSYVLGSQRSGSKTQA